MDVSSTPSPAIAVAAKPDGLGTIPLHLNDASVTPEGVPGPQSTRWVVYSQDKVVARSRKRKSTVYLRASSQAIVYRVVLHQYCGKQLGTRVSVYSLTVKPVRAKRVTPASQSGLVGKQANVTPAASATKAVRKAAGKPVGAIPAPKGTTPSSRGTKSAAKRTRKA